MSRNGIPDLVMSKLFICMTFQLHDFLWVIGIDKSLGLLFLFRGGMKMTRMSWKHHWTNMEKSSKRIHQLAYLGEHQLMTRKAVTTLPSKTWPRSPDRNIPAKDIHTKGPLLQTALLLIPLLTAGAQQTVVDAQISLLDSAIVIAIVQR